MAQSINVINDDVLVQQVIQRYVVTSVLLLIGIAFFSYMVSKGKKKQGIIGLLMSILVVIAWLAFLFAY